MSTLAQRKLLFVLGVLSLLVAVWFLSQWKFMLDHYHPMVLLPTVYGMVLIMLSTCQSLNMFKTLSLCSYSIKLLITPWFITTIGTRELQTGINLIAYNYILEAVLLQVLEIIAVFIFIFNLSKPKFVRRDSRWGSFQIIPHRKTWKILMIICLVGFVLVAIYPQFLYKFYPVFMETEVYYHLRDLSATVKGSMNLYVYHLGLWVVTLTKLLLVYVLIYLFYKWSKGGNKTTLLLSLIVVFASCLFTTSDRAATVYTAIVGLLLIDKIYPKYRGFVGRFSTVFAFGGIFFIFLYGAIFKSEDVVSDVGYKLNAYFSGTLNVAACFAMDDSNLLMTLLGDILRNIPLVVGFFVNLPMSYIEFNRALGYDVDYNSQILPVIGQGYYYMGILGVIIFPIIMFKVAYYLYNHIRFSRDSFEYFAYLVALIYTFLGVNLYDMFLTMGLVLQYGVPMIVISLYSYLYKK